MKILMTAFEPFGDEKINSSLEVLKTVRAPESAELVRLVVPVVFGRSISLVNDALEQECPDAVIMLGQAAGRQRISVERIAINIDDAGIPDNAGNQPVDRPIVNNGPAAYFATVPVRRMTRAMNQAGAPAVISNSAGTFVCNHLFYGVMHQLTRAYPETLGGFIHLPLLPMQMEGVPYMEKEVMVKALETAIAVVAAGK